MPTLKERAAAGIIDLTETGPLTYRELQALNNNLPLESEINMGIPDRAGSAVFDPSSASRINYTNNPYEDYGESAYDSLLASIFEYRNYQDLRGERQPGYLQLINGTLKGAITAGTTLIDGTLGLIAGIGQGIVNLDDEDENTGFLQGLWDNPITNAMQSVTDKAEEILPNYYTDEEKESPWYTNIFTANFWGDKFIKNLGFTVGAFYSGGLYSKALATIAKGTSQLANYSRALAASTMSAIGEGSIEALNNSREWYNTEKAQLDAYRQSELLEYQESFKDRVTEIKSEYQANKDKAGALQKTEEELRALESEYNLGKSEIDERYNLGIAKLNEDRAKMGNIDLLLNIPILTASNLFQFGKLFANGFKTANRTSKIFRNAEGAYQVKKNAITPWAKGIGRSLAEGFEEINQKAASLTSGIYYGDDVMNYYKSAKDPDAEQETIGWINAFKDGIADTYSEGSSWEEFAIGALTGALGMPAFGKSNTQQAYLGKGKPVGVVGGMFDAFSEYRDRVDRDTNIANALNERVQSPEFLNYYRGMIRHNKFQAEMNKAVDSGDEYEFKNAEHSQLVNDIAMWDNAGKLDDLVQMINDAADTSPEGIREAIQDTTKQMQRHPKYQEAIDKISSEIEKLDEKIEAATKKAELGDSKAADKLQKLQRQRISKEAEMQKQIEKRDMFLGAFVDTNGQPLGEDYVKSHIEKNKKDILDTIDLYRDIKREIDSDTSYSLNSEQLATLTWLKAHKKNWDDRAASMSKDIKELAVPPIISGMQEELDSVNEELNKIPENLREENKEKVAKLQQDAGHLTDAITSLSKMATMDNEHFGKALGLMPQMGALIKVCLTNPKIAQRINGDEVWNLLKKVDDVIKVSNASIEYNQKLAEYMLNPKSLEEDMAKADEEAVEESVKREAERVKQYVIDNAATVPQMREVLQGLGDKHDSVVQELIDDEDEKLSNLAEEYQKITSLRNLGDGILSREPSNDFERFATEGATRSFNTIMDNANSIDEAVKKIQKQIDKALKVVDSAETDYEAIVANKLQEILDSYDEVEDSKESEKDDTRKPRRKSKESKEPKGKKDSTKGKSSSDSDDEGKLKEAEDTIDFFKKLKEERDKSDKDKTTEKKSKEKSEEKPEEKPSVKDDEEIDFSSLNSMTTEEAIGFLEAAKSRKGISRSDKRKINSLLDKMRERKELPSAHESGDEEDSNANDNSGSPNSSSKISDDPRFRSWMYARYDFGSLEDRKDRRAIRNKMGDKANIKEHLDMLEKLRAFDFVESGRLGELFMKNPDLKISYIVPKGLGNTILLAVKVDKAWGKVKPMNTINGSDGNLYQVVGVLAYPGEESVVAQENFNDVQTAIKKEKRGKKDDSEYYVSDKFYNKIKHIYSGRMVKAGKIYDAENDESIEGEVEDRPLKRVLHGVPCILGVCYGPRDLRVPAEPKGASRVSLNTNNTNEREGSIWLMVQEADGRYYAKAVKVRRFNKEEYNIAEHGDSPILQQMIKDLEVICDEKADDIDRYTAKYDLQEHLLYFPEEVNILYNDDMVSISINGSVLKGNIGRGKPAKEKALEVLEALQDEDLNLRFQVDTSQLVSDDYVEDLLNSDVLTCDLLRARNVNASFDLYLNDLDTGEPIEVTNLEDDSKVGHTGNRELNTDLVGNTVNIGRNEYTVMSSGKVMRKNREVTDDKVISQAILIDQINQGLIKPVTGTTNIYVGLYNDGTPFGVKKNKSSHSIMDDSKLKEVVKKAVKATKKDSQRKTLKETSKAIKRRNEEATIETTDEDVDEGVFKFFGLENTKQESPEGEIEEAEKVSEEEGSEDNEEDNEGDEGQKPKKELSKDAIRKRLFDRFNPEREEQTNLLKRFARKSWATKEIFDLVGVDGKPKFNSLGEFYEYVEDPKNGLSKFTVNNEEDMRALLDSLKCGV